MRLTNRNGMLDMPVEITVPNRSAGTSPNTGVIPFTSINLYARKEDYEEIFARDVQVFANIVTDQPLQMIPLAEFPGKWNKAEDFITPQQNL